VPEPYEELLKLLINLVVLADDLLILNLEPPGEDSAS